MIHEGIVKEIDQKEENYRILVENTWFAGIGICPAKEGDKVLVNSDGMGGIRNLTKRW